MNRKILFPTRKDFFARLVEKQADMLDQNRTKVGMATGPCTTNQNTQIIYPNVDIETIYDGGQETQRSIEQITRNHQKHIGMNYSSKTHPPAINAIKPPQMHNKFSQAQTHLKHTIMIL